MCLVLLWTRRKSDGQRSKRSSTLKTRRFGGGSFDKEFCTEYKIVKCRRIDMNKSDNTIWNCGNRYVAKEYNIGDDWFFRINATMSNFGTHHQ